MTAAGAGRGGAEGWNPGAVRRAFEGAGQGSGERERAQVEVDRARWGQGRRSEVLPGQGGPGEAAGRGNRGAAPGHVSFQPGSLRCGRRVPRAPSRETPPLSGLAPCATNSHPPEKLVSRRRTTPAQRPPGARECGREQSGVAPAQLLPWSV